MASDALEQLSGLKISDRRIRLQIEKIGESRQAERATAIENLQTMEQTKVSGTLNRFDQ